MPPATILCPHRIELGDEVLVFGNCTFSLFEEYRGTRYEPRLRIGDRSVIAGGSWFSCVGEIEIGPDVLIGPGAVISDSHHAYADRSLPVIAQPMAPPAGVVIESGVSVGAGAAVLPGTRIGRGSYVVAGAVVAGEIPAHSVAAGNPAVVIRQWDAEASRWQSSEDPRWAHVLRALGA
jgi:acetyltransferase-like isoleucine patch superfamily enzyme